MIRTAIEKYIDKIALVSVIADLEILEIGNPNNVFIYTILI